MDEEYSCNRRVQDPEDILPEDSASNISNGIPPYQYRTVGLGDDARSWSPGRPMGHAETLGLGADMLPSNYGKKSSSSSLVTASHKSITSSKVLQTPKARALELATKLEMVKLQNECMRKQRLLQQQIEEEEEEENLRKAQHEVLVKRRQRALVEEQEMLKHRELEIEAEMKYKLAKSIAEMNSADPSIVQSIRAKSESGKLLSQFDTDITQSKGYPNVTVPAASCSIVPKERDQSTQQSASTIEIKAPLQRQQNPVADGKINPYMDTRQKSKFYEHEELPVYRKYAMDDRYLSGPNTVPGGTSYENQGLNLEKDSVRKKFTSSYSTCTPTYSHHNSGRIQAEPRPESMPQQNAYYTQQGSSYVYGANYHKIPHTGTDNVHVHAELPAQAVSYDSYLKDQQSGPQRNDTQVNIVQLLKEQGEVSKLLMQHQLKANLPQKSIKPFGGNPLDYASFIRSFEQIIESRVTDQRERLYYLEQYTTSDPNKLVKSCIHVQVDPYIKAKALLTKKYGDTYKITSAFINKTASWQNIKPDDAEELNRFSLFLIECNHVLEDLKQTHELDHSNNIKTVIAKLPYRLRAKWRNKADYLMEDGEIIRFSHVVDFVEVQARIASNPVYGDLSNDRREGESKRKWTGRPKKITSFATTTSTQNSEQTQRSHDKLCIFCEGKSHEVDSCFKFEKLKIEEKLRHLRAMGVCYGCLKKGKHHKRDCKKKLMCKKCGKCHPTILHQDPPFRTQGGTQGNNARQNDVQPNTQGNDKSDHTETACRSTFTGAGDGPGPSPCIVPVKIQSKTTGIAINTLAYLDTGSDAVFCTDELKKRLGEDGKVTTLQVKTLTGESSVATCVLKGLEVCSMDGNHCIQLPPVYTQKSIPADSRDVVKNEDISKWSYLDEVKLDEVKDCTSIGILIGNNVPEVFEPWEVINSRNGGPYACKTILGWTVHGVHGSVNKGHVASARISVGNRVSDLDEKLVRMYNYDFSERIAEDVPENSLEDTCFMEFVDKSIHINNGHYEIALPLKSSMKKEIQKDTGIPNNKLQAEQRAQHLKRRFRRDKGFHEDYTQFMKETINNGYATPIPPEELDQNQDRKWYLPHHGVRHPKKDKLRVVFDCSAKYKGFCLNSNLLQGPNMTNTLIGVLLRFRQASVAVVADIQAMFHQVKVPKQDQDLLRFLWWRDGDIERPLEEFRMTVHLFGATSSPACASFALRKAIENSTNDAQSTATMQRSFYVDDCLVSVDTEEEAMTMVENLRDACKQGGFRLTKWLSNNRNVLYSIPPEERAAEVRSLDLEDNSLPTERALGVLWSSESDTFGYQISLPNKPATRRGILSVVSTLYDPLGFVCPAILPAKKLLQDLCRERLDWDQEIPMKYYTAWQEWLHQVPSLMNLTINRAIKPPEFGTLKSIELHHFSDASDQGYGTASYLRVTNSEEKINCTLVLGKARVAPLKKTTIPRLELTAATVAVRVNNMIIKEFDLPIARTVFWTDSLTVLRYINNQTTRFHTFVANRLSVIHDGSSTSQWRYVNTSLNPADDASRGLSIQKFLQQDRWIRGPDFLWESEDSWPVDPEESRGIPPAEDPEIKQKEITVRCNVVKSEEVMNKLLDYFHCWFKLKKAVAWLLRFKTYLLHKSRLKVTTHETQQPENVDKSYTTKLQVTDLHDAEIAIVQYVQRIAFPQEMKILTSVGSKEAMSKGSATAYIKKSSPICKLDPFMDKEDGVMKVGGRLSRSSLPEETKHPSILPKDSRVTQLILQDMHESTGHGGRNHMVSCLHMKYWVIGANAAARKLISRCVVCRKRKGKVMEQQMGDLPEDRVVGDDPPFTSVGLDYFGPFYVKIGRSSVKRYGAIFTCTATRAIHIEKADSLDTSSFINALRRFIARRGQVKLIRSDNGTNFVGAERELRAEIKKLDQSQIHSELLKRDIAWKFNPPAASHQGGVWERMIRSIRKILGSILREQTLTDDSLHTLFCEVEGILNSRPITKVSNDVNDAEPLTPNHLLLMKGQPILPPNVSAKTDCYAKRRWKQVQYLASIFWRRWLKEYLPQLQLRQKWVCPKRNVQIGDIVLIIDDSASRSMWQMGRVIDTIQDKKGLVRQARVKTKSSNLVRPITKLCLLLEADGPEEISDTVDQEC